MQSATANYNLIVTRDIQFARSPAKENCWFSTVELDKRGRVPHRSNISSDKMPRVFKEQSLLAHSSALHVAEAIEHKECSPILENARPIVDWRLGGRYVVVLGTRSVQLENSVVDRDRRWFFGHQFFINSQIIPSHAFVEKYRSK